MAWVKLPDNGMQYQFPVEFDDDTADELIAAGMALRAAPPNGVTEMFDKLGNGTVCVRMHEPIAADDTCYHRGEVYRFAPEKAKAFVVHNYGEYTSDRPTCERQLIDATTPATTALFLPQLGEFGHKVMSGIRLVHFNDSNYKIVCCKPGEEVLYPSADEYVTDWVDDTPDEVRVGSGRWLKKEWPEIEARFPEARPIQVGGLDPIAEITAIHPHVPIPFRPRLRGLRADVVIGVRRRKFCEDKNWQHYQTLADAITKAGYTYAVIGDRATSFDLVGQKYHSGDYDTDAAIELMQTCRLYVGQDSGGAHLASTVGCEMLCWPVPSEHRNLIYRMAQVNPGRVTELPRAAWSDPQVVIDAALAKLRGCVRAGTR